MEFKLKDLFVCFDSQFFSDVCWCAGWWSMQLSERDLQMGLPRANQIEKSGTTLRMTGYLNPVRQISLNIYHYNFAFASSLSLSNTFLDSLDLQC
jgi:hypothetical protein